MRNNRGFALPLALVTAVIVGYIGLKYAKENKNKANIITKVESNVDAKFFDYEFRDLFKLPQNCIASLSDLTRVTNPATGDIEIAVGHNAIKFKPQMINERPEPIQLWMGDIEGVRTRRRFSNPTETSPTSNIPDGSTGCTNSAGGSQTVTGCEEQRTDVFRNIKITSLMLSPAMTLPTITSPQELDFIVRTRAEKRNANGQTFPFNNGEPLEQTVRLQIEPVPGEEEYVRVVGCNGMNVNSPPALAISATAPNITYQGDIILNGGLVGESVVVELAVDLGQVVGAGNFSFTASGTTINQASNNDTFIVVANGGVITIPYTGSMDIGVNSFKVTASVINRSSGGPLPGAAAIINVVNNASTFSWVESGFSTCNIVTGTQSTTVSCYNNTLSAPAADADCIANVGPKPPATIQACGAYHWHAPDFDPCCSSDFSGILLFSDNSGSGTNLGLGQNVCAANVNPTTCDNETASPAGVDPIQEVCEWQAGLVRNRTVRCHDASHNVVADALCASQPQPASSSTCMAKPSGGGCATNTCTGGSNCIGHCPATHGCAVYAGTCPVGDTGCIAICTTAGTHACYSSAGTRGGSPVACF